MSHIGQDAAITAISPPDGSAEAQHCSRFYPIARDELIEKHAWRFALTRASLASLSSNPSTQWAYAYALPNGCLRPLSVLFPNETDDTNAQPFTIETLASDGSTQVLLTNVASAWLKYIIGQTDTTKFTPNFVVALSYRLASYVCGPITKDLKMKEGLYKISEAMRLDAAALDAESTQNDAYVPGFIPGSIKARQ
jgi:hypothetical protein